MTPFGSLVQAGLEAADVQSDGEVWHDVDCVRVFARMSPQGKAQVSCDRSSILRCAFTTHRHAMRASGYSQHAEVPRA